MKTKILIPIFLFALVAICYSCKNSNNESVETKDSLKVTSEPALKKMMIIAHITVKPEKTKDFIEAAKEMIEKSNKEPGCKFYQLYQSPYDNTKMVFVEEYVDSNAVNAHFGAEYFNAFGPKISDMLVNPAEIKIITVDKEQMK
ncbi:MAG: putative quinol monooxygenase [Bacteroidales bacterium]